VPAHDDVLLESEAAGLGIVLSPNQIALLERHLRLVAEWSGRLRLTGVRTPCALRTMLVGALSGLPYLPPSGRIMDIGSGAGIPGVAIGVACPAGNVVLVEASRKKAGFLEIVVRELSLLNAEVLNGRVESVGRTHAHRERYDAVTAQAVAPIAVLVELALPMLRVGGIAVFPKGAAAAAEVAAAARALRLLGGEAHIHAAATRHTTPVVVVRKIAPTPPAYPRRPGVPSRRPL
jgi:16S rRNA (guanine527-N7)-methyltransferase